MGRDRTYSSFYTKVKNLDPILRSIERYQQALIRELAMIRMAF